MVRSWQSDDGLPSNVVRSVAQAADGYLWIATSRGLVRFDGLQFKGFDDDPDSALSRIPARILFPLADGDIWIGTMRGGLLRWHGGRLARVWDDPATTTVISSLCSDGHDGVYVFRGTETWRSVGAGTPQRVTQPTEVEVASRLKAATAMRPHGQSSTRQLVDRRGRLWMMLPSGGLSVADEAGHTETIALPDVESGSPLTELCEDREGNLWVATGTSGLLQLRERRVETLSAADGLSYRAVHLVVQDHTGAWWIGGNGDGADRFESGRLTPFNVGRSVAAIHEDPHGTLWMATFEGSVLRYEEGGFVPAFSSAEVGKVTAFASDSQGKLWMGTLGGSLICQTGDALTRFGPEQGLAAEKITALATDSAGDFYVGTGDGRIFRRNGERFDSVVSLKRQVTTLLPDADGSLWVTTLGGGLMHWNHQRLKRFGVDECPPDPNLTCALDDQAGNLWLGSLSGIFRVPKAELIAVEEGRRKTASWVRLDRSDGMLSRECSGGFQAGGWRADDGELWIATVNGLARIRPERFSLNQQVPPVVIEEARANGRSLVLNGQALETGPGRTRLEFRYTGLSLTTPEKDVFRVQLEGLENEWREVGTQRTVFYEAVPPGRYRFRVLAANADGIWNEAGAQLAVEVRPHFWETRWFRAVVAALGMAALAWLVRFIVLRPVRARMQRLEREGTLERERARIARDMHDELGVSLTRIALMSDLAVMESRDDGVAGKRFEEVAKAARSVSSTLDQIVWTINPRNDTVESMVGYVCEFATEHLESAGIPLTLELPPQGQPVPVSSEARHQVLLGVKEALNNVVKYANPNAVTVRITHEQDELCIVIADDGRGFDAAGVSSFANGLGNMRQRFAALGGSAQIDSRPGAGTTVTFRIPLN